MLFKRFRYFFNKPFIFAYIDIVKKAEHGVFTRPHIPRLELVLQIIGGKSAVFLLGGKHIFYAFGYFGVKFCVSRSLICKTSRAHKFTPEFAPPAAVFAVGLSSELIDREFP